MTIAITTSEYRKPLPTPTPANKPFWDAMREHRFLVPRCDDCGHYAWVPYPACRRCLSERQTWTQVSGVGTIYSYTIVERGPGAFNDESPYAIVVVAMEEDPQYCLVLGNTFEIPLDSLRVDLPVRVVYEEIADEDITIWRFGPA